MADLPRDANIHFFVDRLVVDMSHSPAQLIGSQIINALNSFFKKGEDYGRLNIHVEVAHTGPVSLADPKAACPHADTITTSGGWFCNDCGHSEPIRRL